MIPDTLSGVLGLGIQAKQSLDRKMYRPYHKTHHYRSDHDDEGVCYVSLGGSVTAQFHTWEERRYPHNAPEPLRGALQALHELSYGRVKDAAKKMKIKTEHHLGNNQLPPNADYNSWEDADRFLLDMELSLIHI